MFNFFVLTNTFSGIDNVAGVKEKVTIYKKENATKHLVCRHHVLFNSIVFCNVFVIWEASQRRGEISKNKKKNTMKIKEILCLQTVLLGALFLILVLFPWPLQHFLCQMDFKNITNIQKKTQIKKKTHPLLPDHGMDPQ